ncbi:MAG: hypothetical protein R3228_16275, partial [Halioglobus sp.]|nr:hypothetical protein [Halioglobus sp.]
MSPPLCQVAMSVTDLPRTHRWYREVFGYRSAFGTNAFHGFLAERVQGVAGAASSCWWLCDGQPFFQLELFAFYRPEVRALPPDWSPRDIGYSTLLLYVANFDEVLERLEKQGGAASGPVQGNAGERRVCVRDPEGVLLELFERDPLQDQRELDDPGTPVVTLGVALSVPDLAQALNSFRELLELEDAGFDLHDASHEALWGLEGARSERHLLRAGQSLVELVQYREPAPRAQPDDYRISDQGLLNIALGYRHRADFRRAHRRALDGGMHPNWRPLDLGAWKVVYVNDPANFSVEM